jgi:hypothetical protein
MHINQSVNTQQWGFIKKLLSTFSFLVHFNGVLFSVPFTIAHRNVPCLSQYKTKKFPDTQAV